MRRIIIKNTFREIKATLNRFLAIMLIVMIGVAFYTGLKAVGPDLRACASDYFESSNFMDYRLVSSAGFTEEDLKALEGIDGVESVQPVYSMDAIQSWGSQSYIAHLMSISQSGSEINTPLLVEGRLPENSSECAIDKQKHGNGPKIGDQITLSSGTDIPIDESLENNKLTVVGIVQTPQYITKERGSSRLGNGKIGGLVFVLSENFKSDFYNEVLVKASNISGLNSFSEKYEKNAGKIKSMLENISSERCEIRHQDILNEANAKIEEQEKEYETAKLEAEKTFSESRENLDETKIKLQEAQKLIEQKEEESSRRFEASRQQLENAKKDLDESRKEYEKNLEAYKNALLTSSNEKQLEVLEAQKTQLGAAKVSIEQAEKEIAEKQTELEQSEKQAQISFDEQKQNLSEQSKNLENAYSELEEKKHDAEQKFLQTEQQINEAKENLKNLSAPEWHIFERDDNSGYADFKGAIDRTSGIASLLPIFFFAIAALVCLTTMTRMVDEQRTQIGTLKALGYKNCAIAFKYLFYAASASITGSILGCLIGFNLIPSVIFAAYKMLYAIPEMKGRFYFSIAFSASFFAVTVTVVATLVTCVASLKTVPSELMRPQAPKAGKKILLERISFLWNKLKFTQKVTVRNLFRYKKRFWMTTLGVACCSGMLVAGLGLRDSIATQVLQKQFGEILKYDLSVQCRDGISSGEISEAENFLQGVSSGASFAETFSKNITAENEKQGNEEIDCVLMVPMESEKFSSYFVLKDYKTSMPLNFSSDGAIVSRKLAKMLGISVGDEITIIEDETERHNILIKGIAENYIQHYVFMSPDYYREIYGETAKTNQILSKLDGKYSNEEILNFLMDIDGISSVRFTSESKEDFKNLLKSIDYLIWVIIVSAAILALVVLYTLTAINIGERFREIATIKVLGFYDKEVGSYITKESYLLTFFGVVIGLFAGIPLHSYILSSAEVGNVMYVESILPQSFIISAALTFAFTWAVNQIMNGSLKKIDMVEALKSSDR
ncbi:MAG: ABC transporter permease [Oscillospiraceae bacterium]|nr:ABC transporter permease [Oscillospiraceae bacterium]